MSDVNSNPVEISQQLADNLRKQVEDLQNKVDEQSSELQQISSTNYAGGVADNVYNRADQSSAFAFPVQWAVTAKHLEASPYTSPVLKYFKSMFHSLPIEIEVKGKANAQKEIDLVQTFLTDQFEKAGGLSDILVELSYRTLVYGFNYWAGKFERVNGRDKYGTTRPLEGLRGIKYFDPTGLYNFTFEKSDSDVINSLHILSQPKQTAESNYKADDDFLTSNLKTDTTIVNMIRLDIKSNCMGYMSYNNKGGNPLGSPFLYDVYSLWRVAELMDQSFAKNLLNVGEHSFNMIYTTALEAITSAQVMQVRKDLDAFKRNGGGFFNSQYAKLEKIQGIDGQKWASIKELLSALIFKAKGVDIKALGLTEGATRNLAEISQGEGYLEARSIFTSFIRQFNETFLTHFVNLNFKDLILSGKIDMPQIKLKASSNDEAITQGVQKEATPRTENITEQVDASAIRTTEKKVVSNKMQIVTDYSNITQENTWDKDGETTGRTTIIKNRFIRNEPDARTYTVIDTKELGDVLLGSSASLKEPLTEFVKDKLSHTELVQKALKDPKSITRLASLSKPEQKQITDIVVDNMRLYVFDFYMIKAREIERGVLLQVLQDGTSRTFEDVFKKSKETWANIEAERYIKEYSAQNANNVMGKIERVLLDTLSSQTQNFDKKVDNITDRTQLAMNTINGIQGMDIEKFTDNEVYNEFNKVSNISNLAVTTRDSNFGVVRTGVLDNRQCDHCKQYVGVLYLNDGGIWYNEEGFDYLNTPDSNCFGGASLCRCYYVAIPVRTIQAIEKNLKINEEMKQGAS